MKHRSNFVKKLLCLGYGYVARQLAARLKTEGWSIAGTVRDPQKARRIAADSVEAIEWANGALGPRAFIGTSAILVSTPPSEGGCPSLASVENRLRKHANQISWVGYLSTNGVYGDHAGAWVDESAELRAKSPRALNRIAAENRWRAFARGLGIPLVIFRLPGIYGPGRSALDMVRDGRAQRIFKPGQVFSRAHVDDIAAALQASLEKPAAGDLFNIADDEPGPPQDVIEYACALVGVEPPPLVHFENANLSEMAKTFYVDNKRVSNRLMKSRLTPSLTYPTFREGLSALYRDENARSSGD